MPSKQKQFYKFQINSTALDAGYLLENSRIVAVVENNFFQGFAAMSLHPLRSVAATL